MGTEVRRDGVKINVMPMDFTEKIEEHAMGFDFSCGIRNTTLIFTSYFENRFENNVFNLRKVFAETLLDRFRNFDSISFSDEAHITACTIITDSGAVTVSILKWSISPKIYVFLIVYALQMYYKIFQELSASNVFLVSWTVRIHLLRPFLEVLF